MIGGINAKEVTDTNVFVTTKIFLSRFGFDSLRDLPDIELLEDAGLRSKNKLLADDFPDDFGTDAAGVGEDENIERDEPLAG